MTLEHKGLKSAAELSADKPHGNRLKYLGGCRCIPCKAANSRYQSERLLAQKNGETNRIISAIEVRGHLLRLSAKGVGSRTVSDISGVGRTTITLISRGQRKQCRESVAKAILAVSSDVTNDATVINAAATHRRIRSLLNEGFTKTELAKRLGYKTGHLQFQKKVITARNAMKVERFYNQINAEA